jgi:predicted HicB family RNase H-like nuclease
MNTTHDEALRWLASIINREKKSIDFAQTFAKRNSLKHLSGIQKAPGSQWTIPVISWRPISGNIIKWDATQYANLQARVGKMISGDRSEFAAKEIEMRTGAERVSDDLNAVQEEAHIDPEDQDRVIDVAPEKVTEKKQSDGHVSKVMQNLAVAKKEFHDEYLAACQSMGIEADADMTDEHAIKIMNTINETLDKAAA